jgi:hypothetical protein
MIETISIHFDWMWRWGFGCSWAVSFYRIFREQVDIFIEIRESATRLIIHPSLSLQQIALVAKEIVVLRLEQIRIDHRIQDVFLILGRQLIGTSERVAPLPRSSQLTLYQCDNQQFCLTTPSLPPKTRDSSITSKGLVCQKFEWSSTVSSSGSWVIRDDGNQVAWTSITEFDVRNLRASSNLDGIISRSAGVLGTLVAVEA